MGRSFGVGKKGKNFLRSGEVTYGEAIQSLCKYCLSCGPAKREQEGPNEEKMGRQQYEKVLH